MTSMVPTRAIGLLAVDASIPSMPAAVELVELQTRLRGIATGAAWTSKSVNELIYRAGKLSVEVSQASG